MPIAIDLVVAYVPRQAIPAFLADFLASGAKWDATALLLAAGLIGSAYLIHREDDAEFAELQAHQATIELVATDIVFLHSEPVLTLRDRFENGLRPGGLPVEATVTASLEVHNKGREEGELEWHLNLVKSQCPDVFALVEGNEQGEMYSLQPTVAGRSRHKATWRLELSVPDIDPLGFARGLASHRDFSFLIQYRTLRVGDPSEYKDLPIAGQIDQYLSTLADRWSSAGLADLSSIARQSMSA